MEDKTEEDKCGNCYGAGVEGQCCQTCDEVRVLYEKAGWLFKAQEVKQCQKEITLETMKDALADEGGM